MKALPQVVLLEVSHWHVPLYVAALRKMGVKVVAVSDTRTEVANEYAREMGCKAYKRWRDLIERERFDFAFAFGEHHEMPAICTALLEEGRPFAVEKPLGTRLSHVEQVRDKAAQSREFVAVPLIYRHSPLFERISEMASATSPHFTHLYFRFIAGSPERYPASHCAWMLDRMRAGGGCTANLSVHFIDLYLYLSKARAQGVDAKMSNLTYELEIEDYSSVSIVGSDGSLGTVDTGYTFPQQQVWKRETYFSVASRDHYAIVTDGRLAHFDRQRSLTEYDVVTDTDHLYELFIEHTFLSLRRGEQPRAGLDELSAVVEVLDRAYAAAGRHRL